MNTRQGLHKVDTENEPFTSIDSILTKAIWVAVGVAIGMFTAAALIYVNRPF